MNAFIVDALLAEVRRLEELHNDGQPFPPVGAGQLPTGRPPAHYRR